MSGEDKIITLEIIIFLLFFNKFVSLIIKTLELITAEIFL